MEKLDKHTGIVAVLNKSDIDTDQIIPKQFLKKIEKAGFGVHLFHDWRYLDDAGSIPNPEFELNKERFKGASILLTGANFGCGSSREHAPWALSDYGFKIIIAPSFADIFFNNCFKNGMLPIVLPAQTISELMEIVDSHAGITADIDLQEKKIRINSKNIGFEIDDFKRECLLNGWDDIGLSMKKIDAIEDFESRYFKKYPWLNVS